MPQSSHGLDRYPSYTSFRGPPSRHGGGTMKSHYDAVDESTEGCARVCQLILFLVVGAAATVCVLSILNCEFVIFIKPMMKLNTTSASNANATDLPQARSGALISNRGE